MSTVKWHTKTSYALDKALSTRKPVLLDLYNPE